LTNPTSAKYWLDRKQSDDRRKGTDYYTGWHIQSEDLDSNANTPDDVILYDSNGTPQIVCWYSLNSGKGRTHAAVLYNQYPNRREAANVKTLMKQQKNMRLFNQWLDDQSSHAKSVQPFSAAWAKTWTARHPHSDPNWYTEEYHKPVYQRIQTIIHATIKRLFPKATTTPYYMQIARDLITCAYNEAKKFKTKAEQHKFVDENQNLFDDMANNMAMRIGTAYEERFNFPINSYYVPLKKSSSSSSSMTKE
jgi:hypothetical protein